MHYPEKQNLNSRSLGFSLIELIIVLLVGSILLAWGVPNYRDFKVRRAVTDNTNELIYTLNFARAEAIRYGRVVRVRPVGGTNWQDGSFTILINPGAANERLAQHAGFGDQITFTQSGGFTGQIDFNSLGAVVNGLSTQIRVENTDVTNAFRIVELLPSGTVRVRRP